MSNFFVGLGDVMQVAGVRPSITAPAPYPAHLGGMAMRPGGDEGAVKGNGAGKNSASLSVLSRNGVTGGAGGGGGGGVTVGESVSGVRDRNTGFSGPAPPTATASTTDANPGYEQEQDQPVDDRARGGGAVTVQR